MTDITTLGMKVVVKDTLDSDMPRIKANIERQMGIINQSMSTPIKEADRQLGILAHSLDKIMNRSIRGIISDRDLQKLEQYSGQLDRIAGQMRMIDSSGGSSTFSTINTLQSAIGTTRQVGIPTTLTTGDPAYGAPVGFSRITLRDNYQNVGQANFLRHLRRVSDEGMDPYSGNPKQSYAGLQDSLRGTSVFLDGNQRFQNQGGGFNQFTSAPSGFSPITKRMLQDNGSVVRNAEREFREVENLAGAYRKLSDNELRVERVRLNALNQAGRGDLTRLNRQAIDYMDDPRMQMGRGSYSHAFRYASQNAAFALEDYMISSQYGGPKAGFRAITNNLTAIAAAATGGINPLSGAGIIGGVAVLGATAPLIYDHLTGTDERATELNKRLTSPREATAFNLRNQFQMREGIGMGVSAADRRVAESREAVNRFTANRGDIKRAITGEVGNTGSYTISSSEWFKAFTSNIPGFDIATQGLGPAGSLVRNAGGIADWFGMVQSSQLQGGPQRNLTQLRLASQAQQLYSGANQSISALGDPVLLHREHQSSMLEQQRERRINDREYTISQMGMAGSVDIAKRRLRNQLVDPHEEAGLAWAERQERRQLYRTEFGDKPDELRNRLVELDREDDQAGRRLQVDSERFKLNKRDREWDRRLRIAGYDTNPVRSMNAQADVQREQILADQTLSETQRSQELAAFNKHHAQRIEGGYLGAGEAIGVGTSEDARLRNQMFNREGGTDADTLKSMNTKLGDLVEATRDLIRAVEAAKPKLAGFRN